MKTYKKIKDQRTCPEALIKSTLKVHKKNIKTLKAKQYEKQKQTKNI